MQLLECGLVLLLLIICVWTSITDITSSIIGNRQLMIAAGVGLVLNLLYYAGPARQHLFDYLMNFIVLSVISLLFYAFHFWAAGDSKLLILISFLLPARLFGREENSAFPAISILVLAFTIAFAYIVLDSIREGMRRKDLFSARTFEGSIKRFLKNYVLCGTYLTLFNQTIVLILPVLYQQYSELFILGSFFIAIIVSEWPPLKKPIIFIPCFIVAVVFTAYMMLNGRIVTDPVVFIALIALN